MKKIQYPALLAALLLLMTGCAEQENSSAAEQTERTQTSHDAQIPETQPETDEETPPVLPPELSGINPLTGESGYPDSAAGKRPVAVMVNNLAQSYPQYGTAQADIIYELPVEGGVTRMMAVYANQDAVPDVCSVRSARYYFPKLAMGMDALYCHWGAEQFHAVSAMQSLGIDHFDGSDLEHTLLFYRDPERVGRYASEHTGYLRGAEIPSAIEQFGCRKYAVTRDTLFSFRDTPQPPAEAACTRVSISFSNSSSTGFTYDKATQTYFADHNGSPQMDSRAGTQLAFTNVFVLRTQIDYLDETKYLRRIALEGGEGYYISCGGMESIRWEKADDRSPIVCYTLDGSELEVNPGNSYIGIVGAERRVTFLVE